MGEGTTLAPGSWEQARKLSVPEFVWDRLILPTALSDLLFVLMNGLCSQWL